MDLALVITALTGSGGIVALIAVLLQHRQKMVELKAVHAKTTVQLEKIKSKQLPLEHHPLFTTLDEIEHFFMWNFELADEGRTILVRELCVNKLRTWRLIFYKYIKEADNCYVTCNSENRESCNKAEMMFSKMLLEGLESYSKCWDTVNKVDVYGSKTYDSKSFESMEQFLPIFQEWHSSREEVVRIASHDIPNSRMNNYCYHDWWDVLTVYAYAFTQMKYDALNAMKTLNGELTGKEIFGVIIGDIH